MQPGVHTVAAEAACLRVALCEVSDVVAGALDERVGDVAREEQEPGGGGLGVGRKEHAQGEEEVDDDHGREQHLRGVGLPTRMRGVAALDTCGRSLGCMGWWSGCGGGGIGCVVWQPGSVVRWPRCVEWQPRMHGTAAWRRGATAEGGTERAGSSSSAGMAAIGLVAIAQMARAFLSFEATRPSTSTMASVRPRQAHAAIV